DVGRTARRGNGPAPDGTPRAPPAGARVRAAHGPVRRPAYHWLGVDGRRLARPGAGTAARGRPRPLWSGPGPLLGDGLVRTLVVRERPSVRGTVDRSLRRGATAVTGRPGLGAGRTRRGRAGVRGLRRRDGERAAG